MECSFLFIQVINKTGFMSGLYAATEMVSDNVKVDYAAIFHS